MKKYIIVGAMMNDTDFLNYYVRRENSGSFSMQGLKDNATVFEFNNREIADRYAAQSVKKYTKLPLHAQEVKS